MLRDYKLQCGFMVEYNKHKIEISRKTSINDKLWGVERYCE